jgi:hypothetical protein
MMEIMFKYLLASWKQVAMKKEYGGLGYLAQGA